jgi:hypothetical protein
LSRVRAALLAGAIYFGVVFAAGFALGAVRVTLLVPAVGEPVAVALELPLLLLWSWWTCGWCLRRFAVPASVAARALMSSVAFALLMAAEIALDAALNGRDLAAHFARYGSTTALVGLAGQLLFALFPLLRR